MTTVPIHLVENTLVIGGVETVVTVQQQQEGDAEKDGRDRDDPAVLPQAIKPGYDRDRGMRSLRHARP